MTERLLTRSWTIRKHLMHSSMQQCRPHVSAYADVHQLRRQKFARLSSFTREERGSQALVMVATMLAWSWNLMLESELRVKKDFRLLLLLTSQSRSSVNSRSLFYGMVDFPIVARLSSPNSCSIVALSSPSSRPSSSSFSTSSRFLSTTASWCSATQQYIRHYPYSLSYLTLTPISTRLWCSLHCTSLFRRAAVSTWRLSACGSGYQFIR